MPTLTGIVAMRGMAFILLSRGRLRFYLFIIAGNMVIGSHYTIIHSYQ